VHLLEHVLRVDAGVVDAGDLHADPSRTVTPLSA